MQGKESVVVEQNQEGSDDESGRSTNESSRPHYIWWMESICCGIVIAALIATIVLVQYFDHQPLPQWPYGLSLNTYVAILSVILKTSAGLVLAEGISHMKWVTLKQPNTLRTFTAYDDASRGPWGALMLLWRDRGRHIASLGALIIVLILFLEPFTQQIISLYDCVQTDTQKAATIARTNFFPGSFIPTYVGVKTNVTWPLKNSIMRSIYGTDKGDADFSCPSGNCTFSGTYASLGFCSKCEDVTSRLVRVPWLDRGEPSKNNTGPFPDFAKYPNVTLFNNVTANNSFTLQVAKNFEPITRQRYRLAASFYYPYINIIRVADDLETYSAQSCMMKACVRSYSAEVREHRLREKVESEYIISDNDQWMGWSAVDLECVDDSTKNQLTEMGYDLKGDPRWLSYNVYAYFNYTTQKYNWEGYCDNIPKDKMDKFCNFSNFSGPSDDGPSFPPLTYEAASIVPPKCIYALPDAYIVNILRNLWKGELWEYVWKEQKDYYGPETLQALYHAGTGKGTLKDTSDFMRNVSESFTAFMRSNGDTKLSTPMLGQVNYNTVCIRVRWPWVAFSASIVLLTLVFFLYVVLKARGDQEKLRKTWESEGMHAPFFDFKSSTLTLLFHGLDDKSRGAVVDVGSSNRTAEMEKKTDKFKIQLVATERGWKLSTAASH